MKPTNHSFDETSLADAWPAILDRQKATSSALSTGSSQFRPHNSCRSAKRKPLSPAVVRLGVNMNSKNVNTKDDQEKIVHPSAIQCRTLAVTRAIDTFWLLTVNAELTVENGIVLVS